MSANYKLPASLDTQFAAQLFAEISQRRAGAIEIDASEVHHLGGLCLQILLAAKAAWQADGHEFVIDPASHEYLAALAMLGARELLAGCHTEVMP